MLVCHKRRRHLKKLFDRFFIPQGNSAMKRSRESIMCASQEDPLVMRSTWSITLFRSVNCCVVLFAGFILAALSNIDNIRGSRSWYTTTLSDIRAPMVPVAPILLTDREAFKSEELHFSWKVDNQLEIAATTEGNGARNATGPGAGVAACTLVVDGYDMQSFEDRTAALSCLRNKSIVMVGDSLTR
jgi:hypothetical protein